jgi:hypothetical protein
VLVDTQRLRRCSMRGLMGVWMLVVRVVFVQCALLSGLAAPLSACLHPYPVELARRVLEAVQGRCRQHLPEFG